MQVWFMESQISDHSLYHAKFSPEIPKLRTRSYLPPGPERFLKQHSENNEAITVYLSKTPKKCTYIVFNNLKFTLKRLKHCTA